MTTRQHQYRRLMDGRCQSFFGDLVIQSDLFGMVKWPFQGVKWPPTRGWKGHFESPGREFLVGRRPVSWVRMFGSRPKNRIYVVNITICMQFNFFPRSTAVPPSKWLLNGGDPNHLLYKWDDPPRVRSHTRLSDFCLGEVSPSNSIRFGPKKQ